MSPRPRIGSLCTGYGGLDMAVEEVFGGETIWTADLNPAAAKIIEHRWGVPNYGDIKLTHWGRVPKVDIITAGYPCQPFSHAGRRNGIDDPRHLWPFVAQAVRRVRPRYVVLENVAGHRSLGFGAVLADLAALRYVGSWVSLRAADIGAPHGRERVFILAADSENVGHEWGGSARAGRDGSTHRHIAAADTSSYPRRIGDRDGVPAGEWGPYAQAVHRWERRLGRPAPAPSADGQLMPRFVEWMQGLPAGWVTDLPLTRSEQLKALGNGVVPQQAAEALRRLLPLVATEAAA